MSCRVQILSLLSVVLLFNNEQSVRCIKVTIDSPLKHLSPKEILNPTTSTSSPSFLSSSLTGSSSSTTSSSLSSVQPENVIETIDVSSGADEEEGDGGDQASRFEWGDLVTKVLGNQKNNGPKTVVEWTIPMINDLIAMTMPMVLSPRFYVSSPGFRLQLILVPNSTYSDNTSFLGIFFRLVTGDFDSELEWPYQYKTEISIVGRGLEDESSKNVNRGRSMNARSEEELNIPVNATFSIIPNRDPCRLRSAFLRPSTDTDNSPTPDGCGSRRLIPLALIDPTIKSPFVVNGSITIRTVIHLDDIGEPFPVASLAMKYNQLSSEFVWNINNFPSISNVSMTNGAVAVLSSDPFYTHSNGYLIQMFLTLLPMKKAFAISTAFLQGDFDRNLDWPFPYSFEVAIVDQSPNYWRRDYTINLDASSADCGSSPFLQPSGQIVDFCFITVQSMELLTLTHYNFIKNGTLKIRFMSKLTPVPIKSIAGLSVHENYLIAEHSWLVPDIESKLERFDYSGRKVKTFVSDKFYTNHGGYLMQMVLQLNHTDKKNGSIGLELMLLEGANDGLLSWPFKLKFDLIIVNQRPEEAYTINNHHSNGSSSLGHGQHHPGSLNNLLNEGSSSKGSKDIIVTIDPTNHSNHCDLHSFTKPIERNPSCGSKNIISFARVSRSSSGFIRLGSLLVKARIYLKPLLKI